MYEDCFVSTLEQEYYKATATKRRYTCLLSYAFAVNKTCSINDCNVYRVIIFKTDSLIHC
jgi:hypothetical protein